MTGCVSKPPFPKVEEEASRLILRQDNLAVYQLACPEFETLTFDQQRYAYHLCRAALAGRDIYFDQILPGGVSLSRFISRIASLESVPQPLADRIQRYAIRFWTANGNYDVETRGKFIPEFTFEELLPAVASDSSLSGELTRLKAFIFDAEVLPILVDKNPKEGDAVTSSSVNFYDRGVTRSQVEAAASHYRLNGRFALAGGELVEEVYRAGSPDTPPGRMSEAMRGVVTELEQALQYAPSEASPALQALIEYFQTGSPEEFDRHCRLWVKDPGSPVDYILGFIEVYDDPLGRRGSFEGAVFIEDVHASQRMRRLAENAAWFESRMPWEEKYKKSDFLPPQAKAVKQLLGVGGEGPRSPGGINLPNEQALRETVGTKNFLLTNVMNSGAKERVARLLDEFLPNTNERLSITSSLEEMRAALVALHEVVGHGSGKVSAQLKEDPDEHLREFASTLEEARADLVAYWFIGDPYLEEIGVVSGDVTRTDAYRMLLAYSLIDLRDVPEGDQYEEDHARAGHLISSYIIEKGGGRLETIEGKRYALLVGEAKAHQAVGELLAEIMRIKAEGDYEAGKLLVERYGMRIDPALRDEVVRRVKPLDIPDRIFFAMPEPTARRNRMGGIEEFKLHYPKDFRDQMLRFAEGRLGE